MNRAIAFAAGLLVGQVLWNWWHPPAETDRAAILAHHNKGSHPMYRVGCHACEIERSQNER